MYILNFYIPFEDTLSSLMLKAYNPLVEMITPWIDLGATCNDNNNWTVPVYLRKQLE